MYSFGNVFVISVILFGSDCYVVSKWWDSKKVMYVGREISWRYLLGSKWGRLEVPLCGGGVPRYESYVCNMILLFFSKRL